jgi:rhamnosyltransferase
MKILAIMVTYYPNVGEVTNNIFRFIDCVDKLIIWQNTPLIDQLKYNIRIPEYNKKIVYLGNGKNEGIAFALNQAVDLIMNNPDNYTHLLTMDQDSTWINFQEYFNVIKVNSANYIYSPNINQEIQPGLELIKYKTCIISGALFPVEVLKIVGKFNEVYSVDCVDYDFCFRANRTNINIYKVSGCGMNQIYGAPMKSKYFHLETNCYSPKRLFFIIRNHILLWRDYPEQIDFNLKKIILRSYILGKIAKIILMEDNKAMKIISILNGLYCGITNDRKARY